MNTVKESGTNVKHITAAKPRLKCVVCTSVMRRIQSFKSQYFDITMVEADEAFLSNLLMLKLLIF